MKNQLDTLLGTGRVQEQIDLFPHLSMRLHTIAAYFFEALSPQDIINSVRAATRLHLSYTLIGGGSNALFKNAQISGLVVKNSAAYSRVIAETPSTVDIEVGGGTSLAVVVSQCIEKGWLGLEYHKGLPGTVGGALFMNSKWTHPISYVGDTVVSALLVDREGHTKTVERGYFAFAYDYSILQKTHELVVSAIFRLQKGDPALALQRAQEALAYRKKTQPPGGATCGCYFRNLTDEEASAHHLPTKSAGYLIDKAGMKGVQIGSFQVSPVHANFIINTGGTSCPEDLITLADKIKVQVKAQFGVELKEEVEVM